MDKLFYFLLNVILIAFIGGLVFYNLIPLAFTDKSLRKDIHKLKTYLARRWRIMTRYTMELGGYVHDTHMSKFLPPTLAAFSAGTWAMAAASNVWSNNRSAADAVATIYIPITVDSNSIAGKGSYLTSIEVMYSVSTADLDDFATVTLYKDTLQATAASGSGTLNTAASVTTTLDTGHDTAAERKVQDEHRMVVTLSTPAWIDNDEAYHLELAIDAAATSVFKYFGSIANFTLRV